MRRKYLFDMDGTLAIWKVAKLEDTYKPGFFITMEPDEKMVAVMKYLRDTGHDVAVLTAVYMETTARAEKLAWLKKYGLDDVEVIFVPYGENKFDYINPDDNPVLIDDYSVNLHNWHQNGGLCFKYINGFNDHYGTWKGHRIDPELTVPEIVEKLTTTEHRKSA